jgi:hypothetical protein
MLSREEVELYRRDGYLPGRRLLSPAEAERFRNDCLRTCAKPIELGDQNPTWSGIPRISIIHLRIARKPKPVQAEASPAIDIGTARKDPSRATTLPSKRTSLRGG